MVQSLNNVDFQERLHIIKDADTGVIADRAAQDMIASVRTREAA